ncbi:MAG: HNH endonuclease signature motif containing protein [Cyanobacteria bacterium P01_G01_bin.38]
MASSISSAVRQAVIQRADSRCEYCKLSQSASIYTHEVDHVVAIKHDGQTVLENLALTCLHCNRHKGSDLTTFDPKSRDLVRLFNPRTQAWDAHFELKGSLIVGKTAIGTATVKLLQMNNSRRLLERQVLMARGDYP